MKKKKQKIIIKVETKNKLMIAAAGLCLLTGIYGVSVTMASPSSGSREGLVELLSNKFNVEEAEVEKVLKQHRLENQAERQTEMKIKLEEKLNQAIIDGKINNDQKNLILAKREEIQNKINEDVDSWSENREARREKMENYRKEMKQWAEDNGIDISLIGLEQEERQGRDRRRIILKQGIEF